MVQLTPRDGDANDRSGDTGVTPPQRPDDLSDHAHRQLIGYIGLVLPVLLVFLVLSRDGPDRWRELGSISAYYYTGAVAAFVGMLVALSLFLFTYRGYRNRYHFVDRLVSVTAAVAALGVALFPTDAPRPEERLSWWEPLTGYLHYGFAIALFGMFALYALWLFRLTPPGEPISPGKRTRNRIYLACGLTIVGSMGWAAVAGYREESIFVPESVALVAFSVSWLVKGYALRTIGNAVRSLLGKDGKASD